MHTAADLERHLLDLPDDYPDRGSVHLELARCAPSLDQLAGCTYHPIPIQPRHPGWTFKNPSIAVDPDGGYRCLVRYASWPIIRGFPTHNELIVARLNDQCEVVDTQPVNPLGRQIAPVYRSTFGPEDARLFRYQGRWYATASFADAPECLEPDESHWIRLGLMEFDEQFNWTRLTMLRGLLRQHEKNWMHIEDTMSWLYLPAHTLRAWFDPDRQETRFDASLDTPKQLKFARGGSQLVSCGPNQLLGLVHETVMRVPGRSDAYHGYHMCYLHRFVLYDRAPLRVAAVSPPFHFITRASVEFAAGLAIRGEQLVVSFGHHDKSAWLAEARLSDVLRTLVTCPAP